MIAAPKHLGYQGVMYALQPNQEASVVFRLDAPRDLTRFDLDFDLPDQFLPEFPAPIYLTTRPDLGDVSQGKLVRVKEKMAALNEKMADTSGRLEDALTRLIDTNVEYEVSGFKRKLLTEEIADLQAQVRLAREELDPMVATAEKAGAAVESPRKNLEIMLEIGAVEEQMRPLSTLSADVEKMYSSYAKVYEELKQKADQVAQNRQEVLAELDKRLSRWRDVLSSFLEQLTGRYNEILGTVGATGSIRLISSRDIEK
jgi:chromosome segregation ATPase